WRFHLGDDPHWADASVDDSGWETMDLSAPASSHDGDVGLPNYVGGWMAHGHPGYQGYAWYRRTVTVPTGNRAWDILGPTAVDDGYELYWNGRRLGGSGRLGASPRVVGTRPMIFALPADAAGTRAVLAIRAFMQPGNDASADGGGVHVAPTLAPRPESHALYQVQWWRSIAGYIVEVVEPITMFALIGLALVIRPRSSHPSFIAMACMALALSALKRVDNAIVSWTDLMSLPTYAWLSKVIWMPLSLAAWALAWNRWCARSSRAIDGVALLLTVIGVVGGAMQIMAMTHAFRFGLLVLFALIAVRMARAGSMRIMALTTMAWILVAQFAGELGSVGIPTIWFPFGIGVTLTQYAYAVAVPLLGILIMRTLQSKSA
ncbi:glycoside hydrolase family 2, partial [Dyella silvatica]|uniref:glycoside hydrolase family 2 n=1 Tax=Dyella silvatica TaxID=2992128 RepID=UPI0022534A40